MTVFRRSRLSSLLVACCLGVLSACASVDPHAGGEPLAASEIVLTPWTGPEPALQSQSAVDIAFDPVVTYAVFVPSGRNLWLAAPRGERWMVWARSLTTGQSQVVLEAGSTSFPGQDVILISVAFVDGRSDSPFFGQVVHVEDYPDLAIGSQKLRAVWGRRAAAKEDLVVELSVR